MTVVRVYEKPQCGQCVQTKRVLEREGIKFEVEDLMDPMNLAAVKALGHMSAPVVVAGGESWSGFRPDRIQELVKRLNNEEEK